MSEKCLYSFDCSWSLRFALIALYISCACQPFFENKTLWTSLFSCEFVVMFHVLLSVINFPPPLFVYFDKRWIVPATTGSSWVGSRAKLNRYRCGEVETRWGKICFREIESELEHEKILWVSFLLFFSTVT